MADNEQVTLDNPEIPLVDWKSARNKGEDTVKLPAVEDEKDDQEDKKADEAKGQDEEKAKPKVKGGFQVKIDRLTKLNADLEKRAEQAEREREELRAKTGKADDKPKADDEPKIEDFTTVEEFYRAQGRWAARQEIKEQKEAEERAAEDAAIKELFDQHNQTISEARAKYDDFDEAITATDTPWKNGSKADVVASQAFHIAIVESGIGAEILYHYAKHPEELAKLGGLTPAKVQMAIGRLTDKLEAKSEEKDTEEETSKGKKAADEEDEEEKPKKVPVKPISGTAKSDVALTEMSLREFKKARNAGRVR